MTNSAIQKYLIVYRSVWVSIGPRSSIHVLNHNLSSEVMKCFCYTPLHHFGARRDGGTKRIVLVNASSWVNSWPTMDMP